MTDDELSKLLSAWKSPVPPANLRARIFPPRKKPFWRWLLGGSIPVPVPAAACLVALLGLGVWRWATLPSPRLIVRTERVEVPVIQERVVYRDRPVPSRPAERAAAPARKQFMLHGFQPVNELRPRIIVGRRNEGD